MIVVVPADEPAVQFLVPEAYGSVLVGRVRSPTGVTALASINAPVAAPPVATVPRSTTSIATPAAGGRRAALEHRELGDDLNALLAAAEQAAAARPHAVRRVVGYYATDDQKPPKRTRIWLVGSVHRPARAGIRDLVRPRRTARRRQERRRPR